MSDLTQFQRKLKTDLDYTTHDQRYLEAIEELGKQYKDSVGTNVWKRFEPQFGKLVLSAGVKVQSNAMKLGIDKSKADLIGGLDELTRQYGEAENDLDRNAIRENAQLLIEGRTRNQVITQVRALNLQKEFDSDIVETHPLGEVYKIKTDGPDGSKVDVIRADILNYRSQARQALMEEFPSIKAEVLTVSGWSNCIRCDRAISSQEN